MCYNQSTNLHQCINPSQTYHLSHNYLSRYLCTSSYQWTIALSTLLKVNESPLLTGNNSWTFWHLNTPKKQSPLHALRLLYQGLRVTRACRTFLTRNASLASGLSLCLTVHVLGISRDDSKALKSKPKLLNLCLLIIFEFIVNKPNLLIVLFQKNSNRLHIKRRSLVVGGIRRSFETAVVD